MSSHKSISDLFQDWANDGMTDEECGSATEGAGWAGLFIAPTLNDEQRTFRFTVPHDAELSDDDLETVNQSKGAILYCDTQGFYSVDLFDSADDCRAHWNTVQSELEVTDG